MEAIRDEAINRAAQAGQAYVLHEMTRSVLVASGNFIFENNVSEDDVKESFVAGVMSRQFKNKEGENAHYSRESGLRHFSNFIIRYAYGGQITQGGRAGDIYERRNGVMIYTRFAGWPPAVEQDAKEADEEGESTEEPPRKKRETVGNLRAQLGIVRAELAGAEVRVGVAEGEVRSVLAELANAEDRAELAQGEAQEPILYSYEYFVKHGCCSKCAFKNAGAGTTSGPRSCTTVCQECRAKSGAE